MISNFKKISKAINKKGLVETLVHGFRIIYTKIMSVVKIFFLRVRGYDIDPSVLLRGGNFFFQSTKNAVKVSENSTIGKNTRISAGGDGKLSIGKDVLVDDFSFIMAHENISIGDHTKIAPFCFIIDFNHGFSDKTKNIVDQGYETAPIKIGKNVWIATHVVILPGVTIGDGVVIGAGSVVTKNVPSFSIAVGNPAKVIRKY